MPIKPPKEMTRNSPVWSPILLQRKLPMAWGTTIDRVTTEINPFQICKRNKHLTLNDLTTYLILDGWCRSLLSFSNPTCVNNFLSQQLANKTSILYNCVKPTVAYIINNVSSIKSIHEFNIHLNAHHWTRKDISININQRLQESQPL